MARSWRPLNMRASLTSNYMGKRPVFTCETFNLYFKFEMSGLKRESPQITMLLYNFIENGTTHSSSHCSLLNPPPNVIFSKSTGKEFRYRNSIFGFQFKNCNKECATELCYKITLIKEKNWPHLKDFSLKYQKKKKSTYTYNQMLFNILKSNTIQNGYFTQHYINNMNTILPYGGTFKYRLTKIPVLFFPFKLLY